MKTKPVLLSYQSDAYDITYYAVPYDTEYEYELICSLDQLTVNVDQVDDDGILFLENIKPEWKIDGRPDISKYRTLITTGWAQ